MNSVIPIPTLYTRKQVADIIGVNHSTISRWQKKGLITGQKYNGMTLYTEDELTVVKEVALKQQSPSYDESELCTICHRRKARRNSGVCSRCSISEFKEGLRSTLPDSLTTNDEGIESSLDYDQDVNIINLVGQKYYTRGAVANLLGISRSTLARWEEKGATPLPLSINNQYVYTEEIFHKIVDYAEQQVSQQRSPIERAAKLSGKSFGKAERAVATRIRSIGGRGIL